MEQQMQHDVFISFSSKDLVKTLEVVNTLQTRYGIRCWICTQELRGGSNFKDEIMKALQASRIVVFMQSWDSLRSPHVQAEIGQAFEHQKRIIPFILDDSIPTGAMAYNLTDTHRVSAIAPELSGCIAELAAAILTKQPGASSAQSIPVTPEAFRRSPVSRGSAQLIHTPLIPNPDFHGQTEALNSLRNALSTHRVVCLQGVGGIGKSELARRYALQYQDAYDSILLMKYNASLADTLIHHATFANEERFEGETPDAVFQYKLSLLKRTATTETLVILDNFDALHDADMADFFNVPYQILITSRNNLQDYGIHTVSVEPLSPDEQLRLFAHHYGLAIREDESATLHHLLDLVQGHTLTIVLLAKIMRSLHYRPGRMFEAINANGLLQTVGNRKVQHAFSSVTAAAMLKQLFNLSALSVAEQDIMLALAALPHKGIDFGLFMDLMGLEDGEVIHSLIQKSWILHDPSDDRISLHALIAEVVLNECNPGWHACCTLTGSLNDRLRHFQYRGMPYAEILMYSEILASLYGKLPPITPEYLDVYDTMIEIFLHTCQYDSAEKLARDALQLRLQLHGENSHEAAIGYYYIADVHLYRKQYQQQLAILEQICSILRTAAPSSLDYAYLLKTCALCQLEHADAFSSSPSVERTLHESRRVFMQSTEDTSKLANSRYSFEGSLHHAYALYHAQRECYREALEHIEIACSVVAASTYAEDRPWTAFPFADAARIHRRLGNTDQAVQYAQTALQAALSCYPPTHPRTMQFWWLLSEVYESAGMVGENRRLLDQLKRAFESLELLDHPDYLRALKMLHSL